MSVINRQRGFSLLEIAIGVLILGLIIAGFNGVFKLIYDTDHIVEERANMDRIERALKMYLRVNLHLPCPSVDVDGHEDRDSATDVCTKREGYLPFNDIGVSDKDAWGNPYFYRVLQRATGTGYIHDICEPASVFGKSGALDIGILSVCDVTQTYYCKSSGDLTASDMCVGGTLNNPLTDPRTSSAAPYFHFATPPWGGVSGSYNLIVQNEQGDQLDEGVVALVISWGANGKELRRYVQTDPACSGATASASELENCDAYTDRTFVDTKTGENRDFLVWVTVNDAKLAWLTRPAY
ncbi:MAG: type II secretion system protein [Thiotrichales bacterium]|nr:type II secretion system protein [Thiotrichales bacterium]